MFFGLLLEIRAPFRTVGSYWGGPHYLPQLVSSILQVVHSLNKQLIMSQLQQQSAFKLVVEAALVTNIELLQKQKISFLLKQETACTAAVNGLNVPFKPLLFENFSLSISKLARVRIWKVFVNSNPQVHVDLGTFHLSFAQEALERKKVQLLEQLDPVTRVCCESNYKVEVPQVHEDLEISESSNFPKSCIIEHRVQILYPKSMTVRTRTANSQTFQPTRLVYRQTSSSLITTSNRFERFDLYDIRNIKNMDFCKFKKIIKINQIFLLSRSYQSTAFRGR